MAHPAPAASRCTSEEFFELVARGMLAPDDRVELLEGVIVAMGPQNPRHATGVHMVHDAVSRAVGTRALVRQQFPLIAGLLSVPEPDVAVVPGGISDYLDKQPTCVSLRVETRSRSAYTKLAATESAKRKPRWVRRTRPALASTSPSAIRRSRCGKAVPSSMPKRRRNRSRSTPTVWRSPVKQN